MDIKALDALKLPDAPGIYRFMRGKDILYIGKATSLRDRTRSYFRDDVIKSRGPRIVDMITRADSVEHKVTGSVLEALMLESRLIKEHQPIYNVKEKDDSSYYEVIITDERYPRVLVVRSRELDLNADKYPIKRSFGPFPNGGQLREALRIIKRIIPFFDTKFPIDALSEKDRKRLIMNIQIGLYPDVFNGTVGLRKYRNDIADICLILEGDITKLKRRLERAMKSHASHREFEEANKIKATLFALDHIKDVSLIKRDLEDGAPMRVEAFDCSHLGGTGMVSAMTVVEGGEPMKQEYRKFNVDEENKGDDLKGLVETLVRRMRHSEWAWPGIIVIDGGATHLATATKALEPIFDEIAQIEPEFVRPYVVSVVKDERHRPRSILGDESIATRYKRDIVLANDEAHRFVLAFQRGKRRISLKPAKKRG